MIRNILELRIFDDVITSSGITYMQASTLNYSLILRDLGPHTEGSRDAQHQQTVIETEDAQQPALL